MKISIFRVGEPQISSFIFLHDKYSFMELDVDYRYITARTGLLGVLSDINGRIKVLLVMVEQNKELPIILLYDMQNRKLIGIGGDDDQISLGIFNIAAMSNGIIQLSNGKVKSIELPDEFLQNPFPYQQRALRAFM